MFQKRTQAIFFVAGVVLVAGFLFRESFRGPLNIVQKSFGDLIGTQKEYLALEIPVGELRDRNSEPEKENATEKENPAIAESGKGTAIKQEPVVIEKPQEPPPKVLISEIFYDAEGSDVGKEYIELYNAGESDADLNDWKIELNGKSFVTIGNKAEDGTVITKNGYYLIGLNNYSGNQQADAVRSASLPNSTSTVTLFSSVGEVMDTTIYSSVPSGMSWARVGWDSEEFLASTPTPRN